MKQLIKNAHEFLESGEDNLKKGRLNASVSDFFKSIVVFCDYLIYEKMRILPKNHNHRFKILENYFNDIYKKVRNLFEDYIKSYNLSSTKREAEKVKKYANELKDFIRNKK